MIKYLIMDVDGTLTDGKIYMGPNGEAMKAFSIKDGYAVNYILKPANIRPIILTARNSEIVENRCRELGIQDVYQGHLDKLKLLVDIIGEDEFAFCAYFGDDIIDLECMEPIKRAGGLVACPNDAVLEVKAMADYVCKKRAGEGALREFSEWIVNSSSEDKELKKRINDAIEYLLDVNISEKIIGTRINVNDNFYYTIQKYSTKPIEECEFESHLKYVDVQIMIKGCEEINISDVLRLRIRRVYDEANDNIIWEEPNTFLRMTFKEGDIVVLFPENAHRGAIEICQGSEVLKIVGKVKI